MSATYFHGGRSGLPRGSFILPPNITKAPSLSEYGAAGVHRKDRVYVTTSQAAALLYASMTRNGVIYECEPIGSIEPDPDCTEPGLSFQCEKARVIRCIKPKASDVEAIRAMMFGAAA